MVKFDNAARDMSKVITRSDPSTNLSMFIECSEPFWCTVQYLQTWSHNKCFTNTRTGIYFITLKGKPMVSALEDRDGTYRGVELDTIDVPTYWPLYHLVNYVNGYSFFYGRQRVLIGSNTFCARNGWSTVQMITWWFPSFQCNWSPAG